MRKEKICRLCNKEKSYDSVHQKYACHPCKAEYAKKWRLKNPDKVKALNIQQREKRKEYVKIEKLIDPDRFKKKIEAKKFCDKHNQAHILSTDGGWICRECKRLYAINYNSNQRHKLYRKLKEFCLTEEEYNQLHKKTNSKCYICNLPETKMFKGKIIEIAIDHCHKAEKLGKMKVRGLLCHSCNLSLGGFKDNIDLLKSAIRYLEQYEETD